MGKEPKVIQVVRQYRQQLDENETQLLRKLAHRWASVANQMLGEIQALAQRVAQDKANGQPIFQGYLHSLDRYTKMRDQALTLIQRYNQDAEKWIEGTQRDNFQLGTNAALDAIQALAPDHDLWTRINPRSTTNMQALLSPKSPLHTLLSMAYAQTMIDIETALINGIATGQGVNWIAQRMAEAATVPYERALLIARTEINRAYRIANIDQYRQSDVVKGYRRLVFKPTACAACLALDGQYYDKSEDFDDHPRGKCTTIPVLTNGQSAHWETGAQWFAKQDEETQRRILGADRFELWQKGKPLSDMVWIKPNKIWGGAPALWRIDEIPFRNDIHNVGKINSEIQKIVSSNIDIVRISDNTMQHIANKHNDQFDVENTFNNIAKTLDDPEKIIKGNKQNSVLFIAELDDKFFLTVLVKSLKTELWIDSIYICKKEKFERRSVKQKWTFIYKK